MNTATKLSIGGIVGALFLTIMFLFAFISGQSQNVGASVSDGQGYYATTTSTGTFTYPTTMTPTTTPSSGIFGSVIITGAAAGVINIYDATTTNVNLRTGQRATSTILLATFPASTAAGTYTFDRVYNTGLIIDMIGTSPTTTVTYK